MSGPKLADVEVGAWGVAAPLPTKSDSTNAKPSEPRSVLVSALVAGAAIPGLIGTWCWPLLVAALMSVPWYEVDVGLSALFYALELTFMAMLSTNIFQYAYWLNSTSKRYTKTTYVRILALAGVLNIAHPLAVVCIYIGYGCVDGIQKRVPEFPEGTKMWTDGSFVPNTGIGIFFWVLRWIGTFLMMYGIVKIMDLDVKIRNKYRQARGLSSHNNNSSTSNIPNDSIEANDTSVTPAAS